ncbi:MAG: hypothetical protein JWN61_665 [Pseudonocardiales bacterium]|nr:hypothetical protein [Jatrophihabitantaceae bacterium]MCW2602530.1 hypothetical protein [Pseudonocardiales bacterium]
MPNGHSNFAPSDPDPALADALAQLSRIVLADQPLDRILGTIGELAKQLIPGAAEVSMTLVDRGEASTVAYTGVMALDLDERQYETGHGPCLDAARQGIEFRIHDMATETRWPEFTARGVEAGARSSMSIPLPVQEQVIGALNIYGTRTDAFEDADTDLARAFAGYAAIALHNAQVFAASAALASQMSDAMASRAVIEQAKGILMGQRRINAAEAFLILRELSQSSNRKLRDVAQAVVDLAENPS